MSHKRLRGAVKIHGGKYYLSPFLVGLMPSYYQEMAYLEPYCGAANVLLYKNKSDVEVVNDIDISIIRILRAVQNECQEFVTRLKQLKYHEDTFKAALYFKDERQSTDLDTAVNEFVIRRMSRGGLKKAFAWSDRLRGGQPGDVNAWETILDLLPAISERLQGVHIFNWAALDILDAYNSHNVLVYCDPPYLHNTRVSTDCYDNEMSESAHIELANKLTQFLGKVMISGYRSDLYDTLYKGWRREEKQIANHASQQKSKSKKTENVWLNW